MNVTNKLRENWKAVSVAAVIATAGGGGYLIGDKTTEHPAPQIAEVRVAENQPVALAAPIVIPEQLRIISEVVTPDTPGDISAITTELTFWQSQGYNAVLFAYYGEPIAQAEPLLEAIDALGLRIIFAFADYAPVNARPLLYSPRWIRPERYVGANQRTSDQQAINTLLPYCDAVMFHWRGSQLFERRAYELWKAENPQLRTITVAQQKAQSQGRVQQIRARYPNIEVWGSLDVHEMRGHNVFESWVDSDECSRIFVFGLTHSGLRAMMSRGSTINKLVASHFGEEYPIVVGPCTVAGNFRHWGSIAGRLDTLPQKYRNDRWIERQKSTPMFYEDMVTVKRKGTEVVGKDRLDTATYAVNIAIARYMEDLRYDSHLRRGANRAGPPITVTHENGDLIEVQFRANTDAGQRQMVPPPSAEVLLRIHADTEAYIDYLLQDVSGALRVVGDGDGERGGNSDQVGYHDYNWQGLP